MGPRSIWNVSTVLWVVAALLLAAAALAAFGKTEWNAEGLAFLGLTSYVVGCLPWN